MVAGCREKTEVIAMADRKNPPFFSFGVTSKAGHGKHWLLFDLDGCSPHKFLDWLKKKFGSIPLYTSYPTEHGWHFIVWRSFRIWEVYRILKSCPYVDQTWVELGLARGYWFLETRKPIKATTYMCIERFKKCLGK